MANNTDVPEEIEEEYYEPERRERTGVAWLLAIGTLIATVLLATGLFFAGRWTYRQFADNDKPRSPATVRNEDRETQERGNDQPPAGNRQPNNPSNDAEQPSTDNRRPNAAPGQTGNNSNGSTNQSENRGGAVAGNNSGENLPGTGPGGTAAAFLAISVLSYIFHRLYLQKS